MTNAPAGWYPNGPDWETWWDGTAWTDQHRPAHPPASPTAASDTHSEPTSLTGGGIDIARTDTGLELNATGALNRTILGGEQRSFPWSEHIELEQTRGGLKLRVGKTSVSVPVPKEQQHLVPGFIIASLAQRDRSVAENPTEAPVALTGGGISIERTADGLQLRAVGRGGKFSLGAAERDIPWMQLLTVEAVSNGIRVGWAGTSITVHPQLSEQHLIPSFISAVLEQHTAATGRSAGSGARLKRADRREIVSTGFAQLFEMRLPELREILQRGDVTAEELKIHELMAFARQHGERNPADIVNDAYDALLIELGLPERKPVGKWGELRVFEDRVVKGVEAHRIDQYTEAQVFLDGEKQVTMRPSMTAALVFSPLPGSSLIHAQRFANKQTHDMRTASIHVGSTDYSWALNVPPDLVAGARSLAQRINALADATIPAPSAAIKTPGDLLEQLERVAAMEANGSITSEQASALKDRLIAQG